MSSEPITESIRPPSELKSYPDNIVKMRVYNCMNPRGLTELQVPYIRTLLGLMHANSNFVIGEIDPKTAQPNDLRRIELKRSGTEEIINFDLDIAGSSRSHGRFVFSDGQIGMLYFHNRSKPEDTNSGRINYGSLLLSTGRRLFGRQCSIKIVTDGKDGDYAQDNPYFIGDSHGKASKALLEEIALLTGSGEARTGNIYNPCQIRVGFYKEYVGKATISYLPRLDEEGIDLVLPLSCFKIKKPPIGDRTQRIAIGILNDAETRIANVNYQFWQWFSWETVEAEVIPKQQLEGLKLANARNSIRQLAEVLGQPLGQIRGTTHSPDYNADSPEIAEENTDAEDKYISNLAKIVSADVAGKLLDHPWIVDNVKRQFRRRWLDLAVNGSVKFYSFMAQPFEGLPEDTFVCRELPPRDYIVFRNPIRHWGDIRVWKNQSLMSIENSHHLLRYHGVAWMSHKTAAKAGGDFDGDWFQFLSIETLPRVGAEAKTFSEKFGQPPNVVKPPKIPIEGTLEEVALRATEELVGKVSNAISRAAALLEHLKVQKQEATAAEESEIIYLIGIQEDEVKSAIDTLSKQLQLSLDRLKFDAPFDPDLVDEMVATIEAIAQSSRSGNFAWLQQSKRDKNAYLTRAIKIDAAARDTISQMIQKINEIWEPYREFSRRERLRSFRTLFPYTYSERINPEEWSFTKAQLLIATATRDRYSDLVKIALSLEESQQDNEAQTFRIKSLAVLRDERERIKASVSSGNATFDSWFYAYWHVAHATDGKGTGSIVFNLFADEIARKLREMQPAVEFTVTGLAEGQYQGQIIENRRGTFQVVPMTVKNRVHKGIKVNWDGQMTPEFGVLGHLLDDNEGDFDMGSRLVADFNSVTTTIVLELTNGTTILIGSLTNEWSNRILKNEQLSISTVGTGQFWNFQTRHEKIQVRGQLISEGLAAENWRLIGTIARRSPRLPSREFYQGVANSASTLVRGKTVPGEEPATD